MRCLLIGNYGVQNLGDEALKEYFLSAFPDVEWIVVSAHPQTGQVPRLPAGVRSLLKGGWWRTVREMKRCDAVVFGGGSLFTDVESSFACFLWWLHAAVARLLGRPVCLAFQGMGPYSTKRGEWLARWVVVRAAHISVRDEASLRRIEKWRKSTKVVQTFDPVFSLMVNKKSSIEPKNVFNIIPRHNSDDKFIESLKLTIEQQKYSTIKIISMHPDNVEEQQNVALIASMFERNISVVAPPTIADLMTELSDAQHVVTQRFHGALAAVAAGVPVTIVSQGEGDKLSALRRALDQQDFVRHSLELVERGRAALRESLGLHGA